MYKMYLLMCLYLSSCLQKMDTNRDGVVTLEEFLEACRNDDAISRSMSVFDTAF